MLYGHKQDAIALTVDADEALKHFRDGRRVFSLEIEGGDAQTALLKDVQYDYMGTDIIHADFERVNLEERVDVQLRVVCKGDPIGLKTAGAIMLHPTTEIGCKCKVSDITDRIDVDVSELETGHSMHAKDLTLPDGYELTMDPEAVIATIVVQKKQEEEVGEEAVVEGEGGEPEVIAEKKDEDAKGSE